MILKTLIRSIRNISTYYMSSGYDNFSVIAGIHRGSFDRFGMWISNWINSQNLIVPVLLKISKNAGNNINLKFLKLSTRCQSPQCIFFANFSWFIKFTLHFCRQLYFAFTRHFWQIDQPKSSIQNIWIYLNFMA